jgi:hypothetical protein
MILISVSVKKGLTASSSAAPVPARIAQAAPATTHATRIAKRPRFPENTASAPFAAVDAPSCPKTAAFGKARDWEKGSR